MKHILYTVITVLMVSMAFAGRVSAQRMLVDQVVATVGDESILWSDIESRYQQAVIEGQQYNGDLRGKLLEDMLIQKLMVNQAILDSVEVSDSEVASRTDDQLSYYISQVGGQDKLEEYFGKPFMHLRREMMENMRSQLLTMRMQNAKL